MKPTRAALFGLTLLTAAGQSLAQTTRPTVPPVTLKVGDPAPPLAVKAWLKGAPVPAFTAGQVYVVEFWATWCGPCKRSIPHLTELAKEYAGRATIIGVDVWERPVPPTDAGITALAAPFVKSMGDKMDYNVATDDVGGTMAKSWLAAAGQNAIPSAFVIGRDGRIAWIGLPTEMTPVLGAVVGNTWDVAAEQKRVAAATAAGAHDQALVDAIMSARQAHDYPGVIAALDRFEKESPVAAQHPDLISVRLDALDHSDPTAAVAYVRALTAQGGRVEQKPEFSWSIIRVVGDAEAKDKLTQVDCRAIADACAPMMAADKSGEAAVYAAYAELTARAGDVPGAVAYQRKAVTAADRYVKAHQGDAMASDDTYLKQLQARLNAMTTKAG